MGQRYTSEAITVNSTVIGGTSQITLSPNVEQTALLVDGGLDPEFICALKADPRISFSTHDVEACLNLAFLSSLALSGSGALMYARPITVGSVRAAGSTSVKISMATGMLVAHGLSVSDGSHATCNMELVGYSATGTNTLVVIANSSDALLTPTKTNLFTIGPASINSTPVTGLKSLDISTGIQITTDTAQGNIYPDFCGVLGRMPVIRFTSTVASWLNTFYPSTAGVAGVFEVTDATFYLRAAAQGNTTVANATASHIKFTVNEGQLRVTNMDAGIVACELRPVYVSPTATIVYTADSAIT